MKWGWGKRFEAPFAKQGRFLLVGVVWWLAVCRISGQTASPAIPLSPPQYTPLAYDIDWTYLKDPEVDRDWTDQLHYVQLGTPEQFLAITGQIREKGEYQDIRNGERSRHTTAISCSDVC